jgi:hypothetical protein
VYVWLVSLALKTAESGIVSSLLHSSSHSSCDEHEGIKGMIRAC